MRMLLKTKVNHKTFNAARKPRGIVFISKRMTRLQRFKDFLKRKTEPKKKFLVTVKLRIDHRSMTSQQFVKAFGRNDAKRRAIQQSKRRILTIIQSVKRY